MRDRAPLYLQEFTHERVKQYFRKAKDDQTKRIVNEDNI
jgi:hypothetical protein